MKRRTFVLGGAALIAMGGLRAANRSHKVFGLSFKRLLIDLSRGGDIMEPWASLGEINWPIALVADAVGGDLIFVGESRPKRPKLQISDLATLAGAVERGTSPSVSLEPNIDGIRGAEEYVRRLTAESDLEAALGELRSLVGPQTIVLGGGLKNSDRVAKVCVGADYQMKQISQGLATAPGVISSLDFDVRASQAALVQGKPMPISESNTRFWFHVAENDPKFVVAEDVVAIDSCRLAVFARRQVIGANGLMIDAAVGSSPGAAAFSRDLTFRFASLADEVFTKEFALMEQMFRLYAVLRVASEQRIGTEIGSQIAMLAISSDAKPLASSLPGLANLRSFSVSRESAESTAIATLIHMVCGGVSMDMTVDQSAFTRNQRLTDELVRAVLGARPDPMQRLWEIPHALAH